jgi:RNA polymerase sigma-70 factor (ECF subfamily)
MTDCPDQQRCPVAQCLDQARNQSREALGQLWEHCRAYLLLVARKRLDPLLLGKICPSDLVQETFLEAQRDFAQFHGTSEEELLAWLTRILLNNLANASRRYLGTEMRNVRREMQLPAGAGGDVAQDAAGPSQKVMAREDAEQLAQAIQQLPEHYRQVLRLRYEQDLTFEQIGTQLDCTAEAARKLWARAVDRLQQRFNDLAGE